MGAGEREGGVIVRKIENFYENVAFKKYLQKEANQPQKTLTKAVQCSPFKDLKVMKSQAMRY